MNVEEFNFELPEELIAQSPLRDRTASRLMVLNRKTKEINHQKFTDIHRFLQRGDCLVINNTRVLPARLFGIKEETGAKIEVLLLHEQAADEWETLVKPARKVQVGTTVQFGNGLLTATCTQVKDQGGRVFKLTYDGQLHSILDQLGEMPLPPYIKHDLQDQNRYQTVYAKHAGSAAAPTAGLHFTKELLDDLRAKGIEIVDITLHVGLGTFRPVTADRLEDHQMHAEYYHMSKDAADKLNQIKENKGRIIAVGTTSTRTLETIVQNNNGRFAEESGWTDIFIYPPYQFKGIDGLITNFHLPKSTLLMLVSAFADKETIFFAYEQAIQHQYRFFSFGDAMLILG